MVRPEDILEFLESSRVRPAAKLDPLPTQSSKRVFATAAKPKRKLSKRGVRTTLY